MRRINITAFKKAVEGSDGNQSIIAQRLKVNRSAVTVYKQKNKWAYDLIEEEKEKLLDMADGHNSFVLRLGKTEDTKHLKYDPAIIREQSKISIHLNKTLGKDRGYVEKSEVVNTGSFVIDNRPLSDSERLDLLEDIKSNKKKD